MSDPKGDDQVNTSNGAAGASPGTPPHQNIATSTFKALSAPVPTIRRGDAGMHSPDLGYGEAGQVDVRLPFSGRII